MSTSSFSKKIGSQSSSLDEDEFVTVPTPQPDNERIEALNEQIAEILAENEWLKEQLEKNEQNQNSAHFQLVMKLQQTIVNQAMTITDQNLKIKNLNSPILEKTPESEQAIDGTRRSECTDYLQKLRIEQQERMKQLLEKIAQKRKISNGTPILDKESLLDQSHAILDPEYLKTKLAETEKLIASKSTSSVLEQKILEVEYANRQISMIIETNDRQKAEDESKHEEEKKALREQIANLESIIEGAKWM